MNATNAIDQLAPKNGPKHLPQNVCVFWRKSVQT